MGFEVIDERIRAGRVAQCHQILEEGNLQLTLGDQRIAVPAVVRLLVQKQHVQRALHLPAFFQSDGQGQIGRPETDADQIMNDGRSDCLCHFQCPLDCPSTEGRKSP